MLLKLEEPGLALIFPGGGGTRYNELYGEAPPEKGALVSLQYIKGKGKLPF